MTTPYHARYFAHELTRQHRAGGADRLSMALFDACVDLNPHQIDAAAFALRSPLSKGVLLADDVGLGKTIEAGLVMCQYWSERKRRLMVICPASLRKQWGLELQEKFNLPNVILDARTYRQSQLNGNLEPFSTDKVVITSLNFASTMRAEVRVVPFDLVVIDEAHKLRNAYRPKNKMGQNIKWAVEERKKLLLTATPLQNSLLELYGISTVLDDMLFGDPASFRAQYGNSAGDAKALRERLQHFCQRTLRRQVIEYIQYTERRLLTFKFHPTDDEQKLYEAVSEYLMRDNTFAFPKRQRHLTALILRKLLASSRWASGSASNNRVVAAGTATNTAGNFDWVVRTHNAATGRLLWQDHYDLAGKNDLAVEVTIDGDTAYVSGYVTTAANNRDLFVRAYDLNSGTVPGRVPNALTRNF